MTSSNQLNLLLTDFAKSCHSFENRTFGASFKADALILLKHNGEKWEEANNFSL